ncbi:MAG: hypothetical protein V3S18_05575 [Dehalococcoidia bacterium]
MVGDLEAIAERYRDRYGLDGDVTDRVRDLRAHYSDRFESSLINAIAATAALGVIARSEGIDADAITPQMEEAFRLAVPGQEMIPRLAALSGHSPDDPVVTGLVNNWKGKFFEVLVRDRLNDGQPIGHLALGDGQRAVLAEDLSQPGWDLQVLDADGSVNERVQLKATAIRQARRALERYPDIEVIATDEAGDSDLADRIFSSGFSNEELEADVSAPLEEALDGPLENLVEALAPGLPFVVIVATEGRAVLLRRSTAESALKRALGRSARSGTAMVVGALASVVGGPFLGLPASTLTRLGMARHTAMSAAARQLRANHALVASLARSPAAPPS